MRSRLWWIDRSVSCHCCFDASLVMFDVPLTLEQALVELDYTKRRDDRHEAGTLLETLDCDEANMATIIEALRAKHDG